MTLISVELGSSAVECRTLNRESPGSNAFATVSKIGYFCSLLDAPVHSAVYMAIVSGLDTSA